MGYLISGHFVKHRPDSGKVRAALPQSIGFDVYEHSVYPIFGIDTFRATKPSPYPFSAVTPATDIWLDVSAELAAVYEQLRMEGAANGLKRAYINLSRILSGVMNETVLSVCSDDDGNDFACLSRSGVIISGSAKCEEYIVRFGPLSASRSPAPGRHDLHALASEAVTSFLGFPASDLGFGSFDPPEYLGFKHA